MEDSGRREEIRRIHKSYSWFYPVIVGVFALAIGVWIGIKVGENQFSENKPEYQMNLWTEAIGVLASVGITVLVIDQLNAARARGDLRRRLVKNVRSPSYDVAMSAIEELEHYGWLTGENGALIGADLMDAQLRDVRLNRANLEGVILQNAELNGAKLIKANLRDAILTFAKLHNAKLNEAEMQNAKCHGAEMPNARLGGVCLEDADLSYACLEGASLQGACFKSTDLHRAKLSGAFLGDADFYDADLRFSELREAEYHKEANWEKAKLGFVNLEGVDFSDTNMKGADFECAILENADLSGTDLRGANLLGARLKGAQFRRWDGFKYPFAGDTPPKLEDLSDDQIAHKTNLIGAILPNGQKFTEEMDFAYLRRFTDPNDELFEPMLAALDRYCNRP